MNLLGLLLILAAGLAVVVVLLAAYTAHVLTRPRRRTAAWAVSRSLPADPSEVTLPGREGGLAYDAWTLRSRGLDLPVWDIAGDAPGGPVVIFTHGWGDSRTIALSRLSTLLPHARRVLLWDLPGHGDAPGVCSLGTREVEDLLALVERIDDGATPIVLAGFSLGAGVSIVAAAQGPPARAPNRVAGVIAEAPYRVPITPARNVMRAAGLPWRVTLRLAMTVLGVRFGEGVSWALGSEGTAFDRAELAKKVRVPLLVVHGGRDGVSPVEDGRAIAGAAEMGRAAIVEDGDHTNVWTLAGDAVGEFLGEVGGARVGR